MNIIQQYPHCDSRILHKPKTCIHCDNHPDWQDLRVTWGIAFTGQEPKPGQTACPADRDRPAGSESDHRAWGGNTAKQGAVVGHDWAGYDITEADPRLKVPETFSARIRRRLGI